MRTPIFYRNIRARDQLELFLVAAATSLLLVRFYLAAAGYPQIGGGGLHIAHMLWGGALMVAALTMSLAFHGARVQRVVALLGGIGFGVFIDELGKFITKDNDYFYQPAIALIYAVFIILYLTFNFLSRARSFSSREYQLNALAQMEEAVLHNLDPEEKRRVQTLLGKADQKDVLTKYLQQLVDKLETIPQPQPGRLTRWWRTIRATYTNRWQRRDTSKLVRAFFLTEVLLFVGGGIFSLFANISSGAVNIDNPSVSLPAVGQLVSASVAAAMVLRGLYLWKREDSPLHAYEQFRRATLINIFLTQFFAFARLEFVALPGFLFNIALLGFIGYAMRLERMAKRATLE
jgi:hypothetical protein